MHDCIAGSKNVDGPSNSVQQKDGTIGHRRRLLERFNRNGLNAFHLHEIVELLLTFTIPRRDTKKIAKDLVGRYASLGALLNAPREEIMATAGIGGRSTSHFFLIRELMGYCLKEKYERKTLIAHRRDAEEYLRFCFGYRRDEYVAVLCLDNRNQVIDTVVVGEGTVNQCQIYPRTIIGHALRCGAAALILAHNHPGGGTAPSEADWQLTERLFFICTLLELPLLDHLIVSSHAVASLKELPRWPETLEKRRW
ncbi:MAG: RadC family protein [Chitinispirillaceae bacterium]|nr:RadC family protein [Chitinispirillaceae bacterium]